MYRCTILPWHKLTLTRRAIPPFRSKEITCSCGRKYAMLDETKSFLPWDDSFEYYFTNNTKDEG